MTNETHEFKLDYVLCIPTLNPGKFAAEQVKAMQSQLHKPQRIIIIDSTSNDGSMDVYRQNGAEIYTIDKQEFNHGATRQMLLNIAPEANLLMYLTQDAIPSNEKSFSELISPFSDSKIGAAYGRQLPQKNAQAIEAHARLFNYGNVDQVRSRSEVTQYGIKTAFLSNSFSVYRRAALEEIGGFPNAVIFGEDTYVAARMILADWKIAYRANAGVYHSHNYTIKQEFKRYFDVGVFHSNEPWLRKEFGEAEGEGRRFVVSELGYLWGIDKIHIPESVLRTVVKYIGYRMGRGFKHFPIPMSRALSMNRSYWDATN